MNLNLLSMEDAFIRYVHDRLSISSVDYPEARLRTLALRRDGTMHLEAGVVLLLSFRGGEYVFELIVRSGSVAQSGDISCPGGILSPKIDAVLSALIRAGLPRAADRSRLNRIPNVASDTASIIRLFLANALREAHEEIGLCPFNVLYLGALPSYTLAFFSRTIFPLVCLIRKPVEHRINPEVERVIELPLRDFFDPARYAILQIQSDAGASDPRYNMEFPCLPIPDGRGQHDILWGATFQIILNFLNIVFDNSLPTNPPSQRITKILPKDYASGRS